MYIARSRGLNLFRIRPNKRIGSSLGIQSARCSMDHLSNHIGSVLDGYSSSLHIGSVPDGYSRLRVRLCARPIIVGFRDFSVAITHSRRMDRWHQYIRASFATGIVASYRCSLGRRRASASCSACFGNRYPVLLLGFGSDGWSEARRKLVRWFFYL